MAIAIYKLGWIVSPHRHSPELAPSDYHFFGKPKELLRENHYASVDDVKRGVKTWIERNRLLSSTGVMDLVSRWQKGISNKGGC